MSISYVTGDATEPLGEGTKIIVHVCNDIGGWGRGFVVALSKRWPEPERRYRSWHRGGGEIPFALGEVQFVEVGNALWVANVIGHRDVRTLGGVSPVRYDAIRRGLQRVADEAIRLGATVHMPRIGCGLAGGKWDEVVKIVTEELVDRGVSVTVYDFPIKTERPS